MVGYKPGVDMALFFRFRTGNQLPRGEQAVSLDGKQDACRGSLTNLGTMSVAIHAIHD